MSEIVAFVDHDDREHLDLLARLAGAGHGVAVVKLGQHDDATDVSLTLDDFRVEQTDTVVTLETIRNAAVVIHRRWRMAESPVVRSTLSTGANRAFAEREWSAVFGAVLLASEAVSGGALWMNRSSIAATVSNKLALLSRARAIGMPVAPLTVANTPVAPASEVVTKSINVDEQVDSERSFGTTRLTAKLLDAYVGRRSATPVLLQAHFEPEYEIRAFVAGGDVFAVRIDSEADYDDIRYTDRSTISVEAYDPSGQTTKRLRTLTDGLGLGYSAFDFVASGDTAYLVDVTPNGLWTPYDTESGHLTEHMTAVVAGARSGRPGVPPA
jgi:hypothetical protein